MNYSYLSQELHEPADLVYNFLKNIRAIRAIEVEMKIDDRVNFGPTFSGNSGLGYKVCVEVSNSIYPNTLEAFVADCITLGLPIKLYVAIPVQEGEKLDFNLIKRASRFGVGIVTIKNNKVEVLHEALELSLLVQCVDLKEYPKKNREEINNALNTYQNGNPVKGVATICDIIEGKIRKIGKQAKKQGIIPAKNNFNFAKDSLASLVKLLMKYQILNDTICGRCLGLTAIRNDSDHPPNDYKHRIRRMYRLKTHLNTVLDLLKDIN